MKAAITHLIFCTLSLTALSVGAQQSSMELSCRTKAKEVAAQTYNSCVTEARTAQIEKIRKDYQKQLAELKAKYDQELKKLKGAPSGTRPPSKTASMSSSAKTPVPPGVPTTLPARKEEAPAVTVPKGPPEAPLTEALPIEAPTEAPQEVPQNDAPSDFKIELQPTSSPYEA